MKKIIPLFSIIALFSCGNDTEKLSNSKSNNAIEEITKFEISTEPIGGKPAINAQLSVKDLEYQVMYNRAFEAVIWSIPAVSMYRFRQAGLNLGLKDNQIIANSGVAMPNNEAMMPNSSTSYIMALSDLRNGPTVLEVPEAGDEGSLFGQIVNTWQYTIADVGPSGLDKGHHSKYLITPPGYDKIIPKGYIHIPSSTYFISFIFRSIPRPGKTVSDAHDYAKTLKMYAYSEETSPKPTVFKDFTLERFSSLPFYDERYFQDVYDLFSIEPIEEKDKMMMGKLKSIGIERGKPYNPTKKQLKAMKNAAVDAYYYMYGLWFNADKSRYFWSDRQYVSQFLPDDNQTFTFEYDDELDIDGRARAYFNTIYIPNTYTKTPTNWYLAPLADKDGNDFKALKNYKVRVPANVPVAQFWALTIYDKETSAFIYTKSNKTTISSFDKMKVNKDGSVDIYIGPTAPEGLESNWIPTRDKIPYPLFRFYSAEEKLHNKTFKLPDFDLID